MKGFLTAGHMQETETANLKHYISDSTQNFMSFPMYGEAEERNPMPLTSMHVH